VAQAVENLLCKNLFCKSEFLSFNPSTIKKRKQGWEHGSSGKSLAYQAQGTEYPSTAIIITIIIIVVVK
jgi:hypothetical protein